MSETTASLPYREPDIVTILIQASFLLVLNAVSYVLDRLLYCGLIGQLLIGIAWGTPGGKWLLDDIENVIVQLGYLGLILLVYEGGLSTSFPSLKANIVLSIAVAITGISVPIALSFILRGLAGASPLQAFAAGAALCSTSLGTTFTILGTTGLTDTRLGVVLTSAAMLDDVVGLVMVQIISNLGASGSGFNSVTVVRPVFVSLGFAVICPLVCHLIVVPITSMLNKYREGSPESWFQRLLVMQTTAFVLHTLLLVAMVTGFSYAGTSNLFAAYLTGAMVSWWDSEVPHPPRCEQNKTSAAAKTKLTVGDQSEPMVTNSKTSSDNAVHKLSGSLPIEKTTGSAVFHAYYAQPTEKILKPFFFASIGISIPISKMFTRSVLWRGIIYTILMVFGKMVCGLWLVRFNMSIPKVTQPRKLKHLLSIPVDHFWGRRTKKSAEPSPPQGVELRQHASATKLGREDREDGADKNLLSEPSTPAQDLVSQAASSSSRAVQGPATAISSQASSSAPPQHTTLSSKKPLSLHPASILGFAMVSRGEIGFLISSLADSNGIFSSGGNDDIFLIVTWAIVLCTIVGPVGVGLCVRRLKKLEKGKEKGEGGGRDVLGVWGVR